MGLKLQAGVKFSLISRKQRMSVGRQFLGAQEYMGVFFAFRFAWRKAIKESIVVIDHGIDNFFLWLLEGPIVTVEVRVASESNQEKDVKQPCFVSLAFLEVADQAQNGRNRSLVLERRSALRNNRNQLRLQRQSRRGLSTRMSPNDVFFGAVDSAHSHLLQERPSANARFEGGQMPVVPHHGIVVVSFVLDQQGSSSVGDHICK
jgi:hypothetical protein